MRYRYVECYEIKGLVGPNEEQPIIAEKDFSAYLVSNPDIRLADIDKHMALADFMLTSIFIGRPEGELHDLLNERIDQIRVERSKNANAYVIFEISGNFSDFKPIKEHIFDDLILVFDKVDKTAIEKEHQNAVKSALIATRLVSDSIVGLKRIAKGLILLNDNGEKIYPLNIRGGKAELHLIHPINVSEIPKISELNNKLKGNEDLKRVVDLLASSLKSDGDMLRAFLSSYTGLEIYINKLFPKFETIFLEERSNGNFLKIRGKYLDRVLTEPNNKLNILDKFCIISLLISPTTADLDSINFMNLKKQRDLLTHGQDVSDQDLDVKSATKLLTKYIKLYLDFI